MSYLPPSEWECKRKDRYPTEERAQMAERDARRRGAEWLRVYRCRYCEGYHIGHRKNWKDIAVRARRNGVTA